MEFAGILGTLEVRAEGKSARKIAMRFPYGKTAILSDGGRRGRPRKERFAPRAFAHRVNDPQAEIHLLVGHDYNKPLASKLNGTLRLRDADDALTAEAVISEELFDVSFVRDAFALLRSGLAVGISPGFRLPPERAVPRAEAERIIDEGQEPENGEHNAEIREILQALLFELSIVTRPAYSEATAEERAALPYRPAPVRPAAWRWR